MILKDGNGFKVYDRPVLVKVDNLLNVTAEWQCSAGYDSHSNGHGHGQGHSQHGNGNGYGHCKR